LEDGKNIEMIEGDKRGVERVRQVQAGQCAATFLGVVEKLRAEALGARVLEQPAMPMIEGPTLTTTTTFVQRNPDMVAALLHALVDAIHFFKTERKGTLEIINKTCREGLRLLSDQELEVLYQHQADGYQPKPYPTAPAIQNVFQLGVKDTPAVADFNPLVMWDLHHLRAIDDSGYIDKLYQ
jgi:ABC-type nitrate/sulfonate/bicarbonate transport system substrate-binding protein